MIYIVTTSGEKLRLGYNNFLYWHFALVVFFFSAFENRLVTLSGVAVQTNT
jgi:hypothetical protein